MAISKQLYCRCPVCKKMVLIISKEEDIKLGKIRLQKHRRFILYPWTECLGYRVEVKEAEIYSWEQLKQKAQQELEDIISFYQLSIDYRGRKIK